MPKKAKKKTVSLSLAEFHATLPPSEPEDVNQDLHTNDDRSHYSRDNRQDDHYRPRRRDNGYHRNSRFSSDQYQEMDGSNWRQNRENSFNDRSNNRDDEYGDRDDSSQFDNRNWRQNQENKGDSDRNRGNERG